MSRTEIVFTPESIRQKQLDQILEKWQGQALYVQRAFEARRRRQYPDPAIWQKALAGHLSYHRRRWLKQELQSSMSHWFRGNELATLLDKLAPMPEPGFVL